MKDLNKLKASVEDLFGTETANVLHLGSVGVDIVKNVVNAGLSPYSAAAALALRQMFPGAPLDIVSELPITLTACLNRAECYPPMKGGLDINSGGGIQPGCVSAFMGRPVSGTPTKSYIITSGHCVDDAGGAGATFFHAHNPLGSVWLDNFWNGSSADVGIIKSTSAWTPANQFYANSISDIRSVTSTMHDSSQVINALVCKSSSLSGTTCGGIIQVDKTIQVSGGIQTGLTLNHQWEMTTAVVKGDSGGPVYSLSSAAGVIVAGQNGSTWYSTMDHVASQIAYRPCYASTYPC